MFIAEFGEALMAGNLAEVFVIRPEEEVNSSSAVDKAVLEDAKKALSARSGSAILKDPSDSLYPVLQEYTDVVSNDPPMGLPPDRGVHREIDPVPVTKYCVTRKWPLPKEQCDVIDALFRAKHVAVLVRESKSSHSTPTFCVRKPNGKWSIVHAFNKLNAATIPAQTPIPRKDVLQNNMVGCTLYSALDLVDGFLPIAHESVRCTAYSGEHSERYALGVAGDAPGAVKRISNVQSSCDAVVQSHRAYARTYFDDISSTVVQSTGSPTWRTPWNTYERCSSACALISCMITWTSASLARRKSLSSVASLGSEACGQMLPRARTLSSSRFPRTRRTNASG
ncbi:hypothetical protein PI125_g20367 [Phytophthora idaei]|nr:hypothetical protein PI125_g20367 [Phytophthora idaei]